MKLNKNFLLKSIGVSGILSALLLICYYLSIRNEISPANELGSPNLAHPSTGTPMFDLMLPVLVVTIVIVFPVLTLVFYLIINTFQTRKK